MTEAKQIILRILCLVYVLILADKDAVLLSRHLQVSWLRNKIILIYLKELLFLFKFHFEFDLMSRSH